MEEKSLKEQQTNHLKQKYLLLVMSLEQFMKYLNKNKLIY